MVCPYKKITKTKRISPTETKTKEKFAECDYRLCPYYTGYLECSKIKLETKGH